jgi:hypothetical protein
VCFGHDIRYDIGHDMDPDIGYDIGYDVVKISYPISGMKSYPISLHYRDRCTAGAPESRPSYQPHESDDGPGDFEMDAHDMRNYLDQDLDVRTTSTANLGPYARFLADLPDWCDLSQRDYTKAFEALPRPLPSSAPPGLSIHEAIQTSNTTDRYCIYKYHARYHTRL